MALAERIRCAFADAAAEVDGRPLAATVSIGLVVNVEQPLVVSDLLGQADQGSTPRSAAAIGSRVASLDLVLQRERLSVPAPRASELKQDGASEIWAKSAA